MLSRILQTKNLIVSASARLNKTTIIRAFRYARELASHYVSVPQIQNRHVIVMHALFFKTWLQFFILKSIFGFYRQTPSRAFPCHNNGSG